jgi:opacity protein-like surface antigen
MKKLLLTAGLLAAATSAAWARVYVYPSAPYSYGAGYYNYAVPYAPQPYAAPPGFYGFYGFDPTANNWDYYRTDQPGRGNNVESTR